METLQMTPPADVSARTVMTAAGSGTPDTYWGEDGLSFTDLLDIVNPLQHIPFVSSAYREITGDELSQGARIVGGTLYGGVAGLVGSVVNAISEETSGKDLGQHVLAAFAPAPAAEAGTGMASAAANVADENWQQVAALPQWTSVQERAADTLHAVRHYDAAQHQNIMRPLLELTGRALDLKE